MIATFICYNSVLITLVALQYRSGSRYAVVMLLECVEVLHYYIRRFRKTE